MADATLSQWHRLQELILRENDSFSFLQSLHGNWGAVQRIGRGEVTQAAITSALTHIQKTNPYEREQVKLHPSVTFGQMWDFERQLKRLLEVHANAVGKAREISLGLQAKAGPGQHVVVIPKPTSEGRRLGVSDPYDNPGELMVKGSLLAIKSDRAFYNYVEDKLGSNHLGWMNSAKNAFKHLEREQPEGDLLVFFVQMGEKYGGASPRKALWRIEDMQSEFPLPSWAVGWILHCNPEWLAKSTDLIVDCSGDMYRYSPEGPFDNCLCFHVDSGGALCLGSSWVDDPDDGSGAPFGFVQ